MIIDLPKTYTLTDRKGQRIAYVEDGCLFLKPNVAFKALMKNLTYEIYGKDSCYYCNRGVKKDKITIDHIVPQDIGGPTITNNLIPCCSNCNSQKGNKTEEQYVKYLEELYNNFKVSLSFSERLGRKLVEETEELKKDKSFSILGDWVTFEETQKIQEKLENDTFEPPGSNKNSKYTKRLMFYKKYGRMQKPIILDKNGRLLGGYISLKVAVNENISIIPVIRIENVEIVGYKM